MPKEVRYVTDGITLEQTPIETKIPCQILKNGSKVDGTVAGGKLTVTGAEEGDVILVGGYTYKQLLLNTSKCKQVNSQKT